MSYFATLALLIIRPLLLAVGAIFSYILGEAIYRATNNFLYASTLPCLEMFSFIIAIVSPIAFFYGSYHKKLFHYRSTQHNFIAFSLSIAFGIVVTLLPLDNYATVNTFHLSCASQTTLISKIAQSISTGIITAFLVFLNLDFGVLYANLISPQIRKSKRNI